MPWVSLALKRRNPRVLTHSLQVRTGSHNIRVRMGSFLLYHDGLTAWRPAPGVCLSCLLRSLYGGSLSVTRHRNAEEFCWKCLVILTYMWMTPSLVERTDICLCNNMYAHIYHEGASILAHFASTSSMPFGLLFSQILKRNTIIVYILCICTRTHRLGGFP